MNKTNDVYYVDTTQKSARKSKRKSKRKKKRSRKKKYKVKSKKCKKYSKSKEPRCDSQTSCIWIVGKGCSFNEYIKKNNIKKSASLEHHKEVFIKTPSKTQVKINNDLKKILMKYLPKNITIKDDIVKDSVSKKHFSISNYNIPVNKNLIKLDQQRTSVILNKKALQYFRNLVNNNTFEIGGKLDFNLDNLFERSTTFLGKMSSVVLNIYDYEVPYHTHPLVLLSEQGIFNTPSVGGYEDESYLGDLGIYLWHTLRTDKYLQQCNIVFAPDGVYVWYYSQELYNTFKKYKNNYTLFKKHYFKVYKKIFDYKLHTSRLVDPLFNNHWIKNLEKMGIFMFKYTHQKHSYGLDWNTYWDIHDAQTYKAVQKITKKTIPKILKGVNVYPDIVPLYIVPIEPLEALN